MLCICLRPFRIINKTFTAVGPNILLSLMKFAHHLKMQWVAAYFVLKRTEKQKLPEASKLFVAAYIYSRSATWSSWEVKKTDVPDRDILVNIQQCLSTIHLLALNPALSAPQLLDAHKTLTWPHTNSAHGCCLCLCLSFGTFPSTIGKKELLYAEESWASDVSSRDK